MLHSLTMPLMFKRPDYLLTEHQTQHLRETLLPTHLHLPIYLRREVSWARGAPGSVVSPGLWSKLSTWRQGARRTPLNSVEGSALQKIMRSVQTALPSQTVVGLQLGNQNAPASNPCLLTVQSRPLSCCLGPHSCRNRLSPHMPATASTYLQPAQLCDLHPGHPIISQPVVVQAQGSQVRQG
jgi:hypothetical protein